MTATKFSAWSLLASLLVMLISGLFSDTAAPPTALSSIDAVADVYRQHGSGLLFKSLGLLIAVPLYFPACCALSLAMNRMQPRYPILAGLQLVGGIFALIGPFLAGLVIMTAVVRSDASPDIVATLNDFAIILIVASTFPAVFQGVGLGIAILKDRSARPVLPRWFAWISLFWGIVAQGGVFSVYFRAGPLSSTGIIGFILPMISLLAWMLAAIVVLFRMKPEASGISEATRR